MKLPVEQVNALIRKRRSIFPKTYIDKKITREVLTQILENANMAPNHRHTEPWRFKVFHTKISREQLAAFLANEYKRITSEDKFSNLKYEKTLKKPIQSGCVIAICMQRDPKESVPEWEEIAAVSCAVQNMWLSCHSYGIGAYWSSPKTICSETGARFLNLEAGQRCLGLFYMGYHELPEMDGKRSPVSEKTEWL